MTDNVNVVNLHLDRSDSKKAMISAAGNGLLVVSAYAGAGWLGNQLTGASKPLDFSAAVLLPLLPWTLFRSKIMLQLIAEGLVYLIIGAVIKDLLGSSFPGFLSQWLLFTLGYLRMERADYAAQSKPTDSTNLPPGQI